MTVVDVKTLETAAMMEMLNLTVHAMNCGPENYVKPKVRIQLNYEPFFSSRLFFLFNVELLKRETFTNQSVR